jgi:hypothetical protein
MVPGNCPQVGYLALILKEVLLFEDGGLVDEGVDLGLKDALDDEDGGHEQQKQSDRPADQVLVDGSQRFILHVTTQQ